MLPYQDSSSLPNICITLYIYWFTFFLIFLFIYCLVDGKLYTCGEGDSGKLGLPDHTLKKSPLSMHCVPAFDRKVVWVSCGGNHTVALTGNCFFIFFFMSNKHSIFFRIMLKL